MGNINQSLDKLPKVSTRQFERNFRNRQNNDSFFWVDEAGQIFRISDLAVNLLEFKKEDLLYFPLEHFCPPIQPHIKKETNYFIYSLATQSCQCANQTIDVTERNSKENQLEEKDGNEEKEEDKEEEKKKEKEKENKKGKEKENKKEKETEIGAENKKAPQTKNKKKKKKKQTNKNKKKNSMVGISKKDRRSLKKYLWTNLGILAVNFDGKLVFKVRIFKRTPPKNIIKLRVGIETITEKLNVLQKDVSEKIEQDKKRKEQVEIREFEKKIDNFIEQSNSFMKEKKEIELQILNIEDELETRKQEIRKIELSKQEEGNNNNSNESNKDNEENNIQKEINNFMKAIELEKKKLKYSITRFKDQKLKTSIVNKMKYLKLKRDKSRTETKRMKKESQKVEKQIEHVNKQIEQVIEQTKKDILNSKEIVEKRKKILAIKNDIEWTQDKIQRVNKKIKDKMKDNQLEKELLEVQRKLKKMIQINNDLQMNIQSFRYYTTQNDSNFDDDEDISENMAIIKLQSLDHKLPSTPNQLSKEILKDKTKNIKFKRNLYIQKSESYDSSNYKFPRGRHTKTRSSDGFSPKSKKKRKQYRVRLSPKNSTGSLFSNTNVDKNYRKKQRKKRKSFNELSKLEKVNSNTKSISIKELSLLDSFESFFQLPYAVKFFQEWMSDIFSQEILLFYLDLSFFKENYSEENSEELCDYIIENYINDGSIFEIELEFEEQQEILNRWELQDFGYDLFDKVSKKITQIISNDFFPRFVESIYFQELSETDSKKNYKLKQNSYLSVTLASEIEDIKALNQEIQFVGEARNPILLCQELLLDLIDIIDSEYSFLKQYINTESIFRSLSFKKFLVHCCELQNIDLSIITESNPDEKKSFFINLYNIMSIHYLIVNRPPSDARSLNLLKLDCKYKISGELWSLSEIYDHLLKLNTKNKKLKIPKSKFPKDLACSTTDPRIHFTLFTFNSQPINLKVYYPESLNSKLHLETINYLNSYLKLEHTKQMIILPQIFNLCSRDFGTSPSQILFWIRNFLQIKDPINLYFYGLTTENFKVEPLILFTNIFYDKN
ncbi:electron carrier/ protein disulfide oxidoreductase [Anaeramoeba flamelloides]|uniref:Electron carrier/ protein disulfide oxidoreductase n=1 Tax=Anaeramoeba flamelloides TaxID=1746091 RepID=A0ABQ8XY38_9EUKA|nr:electron carrier/ protein disulfide oxidoreductase [Anaeramoeba flamelloides]